MPETMPRELITIQIGQCGNQLGCKFWDLALREHAAHSKNGIYDDSLSSFFRNVDSRDDSAIPVGEKVRTLKARTVLVDMEEGVLNELLRGNLGEIFDERQFISDVSGSGNNWAHGHKFYGQKYGEEIIERVRHTAEACESLQSFFLMHSLGGGTGSGLGTYILSLLEDEYPDVFRFVTAVFPSEDDDVVVSPYNSVLSLNKLSKHADCVLPIENQALIDIVNRVEKPNEKTTADITSLPKKGKSAAFDSMNMIGAHLLNDLTSSMRFEGSLNVDLNEITMNLVPYPKLHFIIPALSPLQKAADMKNSKPDLKVMFKEVMSPQNQLIKANPQNGTYLACGLMARGNVSVSDINRNVADMRNKIRMASWNQEGFKTGLCSVPALGFPTSLLALSNSTCITNTFNAIKGRFNKLYKHKLYVHHFTEYMEAMEFDEANTEVEDLIGEYESANQNGDAFSHQQQGLRLIPEV